MAEFSQPSVKPALALALEPNLSSASSIVRYSLDLHASAFKPQPSTISCCYLLSRLYHHTLTASKVRRTLVSLLLLELLKSLSLNFPKYLNVLLWALLLIIHFWTSQQFIRFYMAESPNTHQH